MIVPVTGPGEGTNSNKGGVPKEGLRLRGAGCFKMNWDAAWGRGCELGQDGGGGDEHLVVRG